MTEIRIFGAHDERTKEQITRCMQYGRPAPASP
jgi:hypothetical protein